MILIGEYNDLIILRDTEPGLFLGDEAEDEEVLLPNRYVPNDFEIGDHLKVFVYLDNEERLVAVTDTPYVTKNNFALLRCNDVNDYGAFLDWGMVKQLFCPFKEQAYKMKIGGWYLIYCYLDQTSERLVASSKTNQFLDNKNLTVSVYDEVDIIISHPSELGMNVIVNKQHSGLIFKNQIFKDLSIGDQLKGCVFKIRSGNKLDIRLSQSGYRSIEPNAKTILEFLERNDGFLDLTDKSSPEDIKSVIQMSKKSFKKALGSLYKNRSVTLREDGIYLNKK